MEMIIMNSGFQIMLAGILIKLLEWILLEHLRQKQLGNRKE